MRDSGNEMQADQNEKALKMSTTRWLSSRPIMIASLCGNVLLAIIAAVVIGYRYFTIPPMDSQTVSRYPVTGSEVEPYRMIHLDAFTIRLPENQAFDFLSFSLAVAMDPEHPSAITTEQIRQVRASIYDAVSRRLEGNSTVMSVVSIRRLISSIIHQHAPFADTKQVYVTEFFAI